MSRTSKRLLQGASSIVAVLLTVAVASYALRLLVVGKRLLVFQEGEISGSVQYARDPAAVVPLLASALLIAGLATRKLTLAWVGLVVLLAFAGLFLFGIGGGLLPATGLLLMLLIVISLIQKASPVPSEAGKNTPP